MIGVLFWFCIVTIIYIYAGYPLVLALLAHFRREPKLDSAGELPSVTLLITAHNEEAAIAHKLENSLTLDYPREYLQILVVDDGSDDHTAEIVCAYADRGVEIASNSPRRGKLAAINRAMGRVRGDLVLFSDANNLYDPQVPRAIVPAFTDPHVGGASGAKLIRGGSALGESEGLYWKYESFIKKQETRLGSCTSASGDLFAMRRRIYQAPPDHIVNEDAYLVLSVIAQGYRVVYVPAARSFDSISASAQGEMERRARIVAGRYQTLTLVPALIALGRPVLVWQVVSHKFLRPLVPLAMLGALVANVLAAAFPVHGHAWVMLAYPVNWTLLCLQLSFYALALAGNRLRFSGTVGKLMYLPTFLLNSNLATVVGLVRFATRRQSTRWRRVQRREENPAH